MKILGIDGMTMDQLQGEIREGGRFVLFPYCVSIVVMTFRRSSDIHYIPPGHSGFVKGLPYALISLLLGWWGIPWGLIYTPGCLGSTLSGGRDVTREVLGSLG